MQHLFIENKKVNHLKFNILTFQLLFLTSRLSLSPAFTCSYAPPKCCHLAYYRFFLSSQIFFIRILLDLFPHYSVLIVSPKFVC